MVLSALLVLVLLLCCADPDFTAEGLLAAVNKARQRSLRDAPDFELIEAYTPIGLSGQQAAAAAARATAIAEAQLSSNSQQQQQRQWWQQQQQAGVKATPLATGSAGYWTPGKAAFWGVVVVFSVLGYCWDRWLADEWEGWCLERRQVARQRGRKFTVQENFEDLMQVLMNRKIAEAEAAASGEWEEEEVGLGRRAKGMTEWGGFGEAGGVDGGSSGMGGNGSSSSSRREGTGSRSWTPDGPMLPAEWQPLPGDGKEGSREAAGTRQDAAAGSSQGVGVRSNGVFGSQPNQ